MADNPNFFDNNLSTTRLIAGTPGVVTYTNSPTDNGYSIGPNDLNDYYQFTVSSSSNAIVKLNPQGGDLNLAVLDSGGNPILGRTTNNPSGLAEAVISDAIDPLQPGQTYYIRVSGNSATEINYSLTVETNPRSRADLLWRGVSGDGGNGIWRMNGTQVTGYQVSGPPVPNTWWLNEIVDMNGDGATDYIWHEPNLSVVGVWLMDAKGEQILSAVSLPSVGGNWFLAGATDFDNNGSADLVWQESASGYTGVWMMDGTTFLSAAALPSIGPGWLMEGTDDFNQDNQSDLFFRNLSTGENVVWLMNGMSFAAAISLPSRPVTWRMQGIGDFNGDGDQDLLWRDYESGNVDVWFMNQTTSIGTSFISNVDPTSFLIAGVIKNVQPVDLAGDSTATAFNIGTLEATATFSDDISAADLGDLYGFNLAFASKVGITGRGTNIPALATFEILAADGITVLGTATSNGADESKLAELTLEAGNYYVRVKNIGTSDTRYTLDITGERVGSNLLFPTAPPPITVFKYLNGTEFSSTTAVSVKDPFTFNLDYAVTYNGGGLSEFEVGFYLSADGTLDANDFRFDLNGDTLGNAADVTTITGTSPDTRITRTQQLTLPKFDNPFWANRGSDNSYNIIIVLDPENKIQEIDRATGLPAETDNAFAAPIAIEPFSPDVIPQNFNVVQDNAVKSGRIDLTGFINNIGSARSDVGNPLGTQTLVRFYLSRDTVANVLTDPNFVVGGPSSTSDILLTTTPRPLQYNPINVGEQISIGNGVFANLPSNLGWAGYANQPNNTFYVLMVVDPSGTLEEIPGGEANNAVFDSIVIV